MAAVLVGLGLGLLFVWWRWPAPRPAMEPAPLLQADATDARVAPADNVPPHPVPGALPVNQLNSPAKTIHDDVRLLEAVFEQWQSNFAGEGNPVGDNAEITAALTGKNRLELDLIPKAHPAINAWGELCDRWGTPFRFHQLSGAVMEIVSAGPDRDFATADDVASQ